MKGRANGRAKKEAAHEKNSLKAKKRRRRKRRREGEQLTRQTKRGVALMTGRTWRAVSDPA